MIVHIFTRHSRTCPQTDPAWKRCRCTKWVRYTADGDQVRESTKAQSWAKAVEYARGIELNFDRIAAGHKPKHMAPATVAQAVTAYLDYKRRQHLKPSTIRKREHWFERDLLPWCKAHLVHYVSDLDLDHLRRWASTWKLGPLASQKKQESLRQFFTFCQSSGWVHENPAKGLSKIKVVQKPTDYFTDAEMDRMLKAAEGKLRVLVLLMRWSGMSIRDAVTLERARLSAEDQIFLYRAKTGTPVHIVIPPDVADQLRKVECSNDRYFFWDGKSKPESAVGLWQKYFREMFKKADLHHADGSRKPAHPHMLRDTFAVNLLICGVPLEDVKEYLGHTSIRTTEKHYAPFVMARMERMDENLRAAWRRV
jgi:integrase/recombinase XerD